MENQHKKIKGYRELNHGEISLMNGIKEMGDRIGEVVDELSEVKGIDQRWVAIGRTHLQQGLMALTRAVEKPDFF